MNAEEQIQKYAKALLELSTGKSIPILRETSEPSYVPLNIVLDKLTEIQGIVNRVYDMTFDTDYHPRQEREQEMADGITKLHTLLNVLLSEGSFAKESAREKEAATQ